MRNNGMINHWYTANELANFKLPELPATKAGLIKRAEREGWAWQARNARGGGKEYSIDNLPEAAKLELYRKAGAEHEIKLPAKKETTDLANVKDWQRQAMDARLMILSEVEKMAQAFFDGAILKAEKTFADMAKGGEHPDWLMERVQQANVRGGKKGSRRVSKSTLRYWRTILQKQGEYGLLPAMPKQPKAKLEWLEPFLKEWQKPTKPSIVQAYEVLEAHGVNLPHIDTVRRHIRQMPHIEAQRGRVLSRKMRDISKFKRRTADMLLPNDVYTADGHKADFEVYDIISGNIFRPEIISVLDVKTRLCVGWSTPKI